MTLNTPQARKVRRRLLALSLLALLVACGKAPAPPEPPRPVLTRVLGDTAGEETLTYSGEVRSRYETPLAFRIPGKITARLVDAGAVVKAGQVLATIDPADSALSAMAAAAQLDLATADRQRFRQLREKNFVSQAALDARETSYKAAKAQAELARNQASYTVLKADKPGVIGLIAAEVGQVVAAGQTVMRLARADTLEVAIAIPEGRMPEVRALGAAEVTLWADDKARYAGALREVSPVADPLTRTYAARVSIDQPDARVLLGMTAKLRFLRRDGSTRLTVPLTAIFQHDGKPALWIVGADGTVSLRPVANASYREDTAVIESGASAGERIVVAGVHKLTAGERVHIIGQAHAEPPSRRPDKPGR